MVRFGDREVGDGAPCFITFEAGATHDGVDTAKRLARYAAEAGADAVKFQFIDPDRLVADKSQSFSYEVLIDRETGETKSITERLYDILCRRVLSEDEWRELKGYCDSLGLTFFATVSFEEEAELLVDIGCQSIKIASADVNHHPLIRHLARTGLCLQLDTGNATIGEIEAAVDIICSEGNENIVIHHCPSGYPARLESINLNVITTLKQMFPFPIAFSDHSPGWEMDIAAVALGANLVEKTITEDRTTRSIEHIMSIERPEMVAFVQSIRELEVALGSPRRTLYPAEREKRDKVRRSAFLKAAAKAGQSLRQVEVDFRRPGTGISPDLFEKLFDLHLNSDLPAGHQIILRDLK